MPVGTCAFIRCDDAREADEVAESTADLSKSHLDTKRLSGQLMDILYANFTYRTYLQTHSKFCNNLLDLIFVTTTA